MIEVPILHIYITSFYEYCSTMLPAVFSQYPHLEYNRSFRDTEHNIIFF